MSNLHRHAPLRVALVGLGTVGGGVIRLLETNGDLIARRAGCPIQIVAISARDRHKDRGVDLSPYEWVDDMTTLATRDDVDVVVELIGGSDGPALALARQCLTVGKPFVTANKAMLAHHGLDLARLAEQGGIALKYEAAVAGGIPVIKGMREGAAANEISGVYGILNGTCNYILTRMEKEGLSFADCLKEAQRLGYAEADPAFDIEGNDTAHKLAILTTLAFGSQIAADDIYLEGITNISIEDIRAAADLGYRIKLLGVAQLTDSGIEQRVHPTMVPLDSVIAQVDGVTNAVAIESDILGELLMVGPGAGGNATASAVLGDIADVAKSRPGAQQVPALGRPAAALEPYRRARIQSHEGGYFIRLTVEDRAGVFAGIATHMAANAISLESIVQRPKPRGENGPQTIILVTHATREDSVRGAVEAISADGYLLGAAQVIRIERPKNA